MRSSIFDFWTGQATILYLISITILLIYAFFFETYAEIGWKSFGYYTVFMTIVLDLPALAAYSIGMIETPGISSLLLVVNRIIVLSSNGGNNIMAETIGFVGCKCDNFL